MAGVMQALTVSHGQPCASQFKLCTALYRPSTLHRANAPGAATKAASQSAAAAPHLVDIEDGCSAGNLSSDEGGKLQVLRIVDDRAGHRDGDGPRSAAAGWTAVSAGTYPDDAAAAGYS